MTSGLGETLQNCRFLVGAWPCIPFPAFSTVPLWSSSCFKLSMFPVPQTVFATLHINSVTYRFGFDLDRSRNCVVSPPARNLPLSRRIGMNTVSEGFTREYWRCATLRGMFCNQSRSMIGRSTLTLIDTLTLKHKQGDGAKLEHWKLPYLHT